jgi:hypothetical protein
MGTPPAMNGFPGSQHLSNGDERMAFAKGDSIKWKWRAHEAEGKVRQKFTRRVKRTIKGQAVIRNASADEPAYLVVQEDGGRALKSESELSKQ